MHHSPVKHFIWKVLLWLPVCFAGWYFMAGFITLPVNYLTEWVMTSLFPHAFSEINPKGHLLEVVSRFTPPPQPGLVIPEGQIAELVFEVNALMYGYSIPLYTALILASPGAEKTKWLQWIAGFFVLTLMQVWGVSFDILKTVIFDLGQDVSRHLALSALQREGVALGYQLGYLIFPAVTPLALWIGLHQGFLWELAPNLAKRLEH